MDVSSSLVLQTNNVFKRFGKIGALTNFNLRVHRGECVGLLGPNGAGKSTALAIMAGLLTPDLGTVSIVNRQNPENPAVRQHIGFVPQHLALYPELSVRENLVFFGSLHGLRGTNLEYQVARALEFAALEDRQNQLVRILSGGMQRRLNLACATLHEPALLLLDEPTVGIDQQSRQHLFECVRQLRRAGKAIIYCTHYMEEAETLCDQLSIMDHGQVVAEGSVLEFFERYGGATILRAKLTQQPASKNGPQARPSALSDPADFDGAHLSSEGWISIPCADIRQGLARLMTFDVPLGELHIQRARLEDVVLSITGRGVRDT